MTHYDRIALVIRHLDTRFQTQPDLDELASVAGVSRYHLHRLFSEWAGITPKDFLQWITHNYAREMLRRGASVLEAALEAGLSGPSRLHDLCIALEAITPGQLKSGGCGVAMWFGFAQTPFGTCMLARSERGIVHLSFVAEGEHRAAVTALRDEWPMVEFERNDEAAAQLAQSIFRVEGGGRLPGDRHLRALVRGTAFQVRVWRALLRVPPGAAVSYGTLARAAGSPCAARAAGTAVGDNPVAFLIPCHRVIRATGALGGYRWGVERKRAILAWEARRAPAPRPRRR